MKIALAAAQHWLRMRTDVREFFPSPSPFLLASPPPFLNSRRPVVRAGSCTNSSPPLSLLQSAALQTRLAVPREMLTPAPSGSPAGRRRGASNDANGSQRDARPRKDPDFKRFLVGDFCRCLCIAFDRVVQRHRSSQILSYDQEAERSQRKEEFRVSYLIFS